MAKNELPPDLCIEIALWDRFNWGPMDTESISLRKMREIFIILEQQRISKDAIENLGRPTEHKLQRILTERARDTEQKRKKTGSNGNKSNVNKGDDE